jgi:hypothetical protein
MPAMQQKEARRGGKDPTPSQMIRRRQDALLVRPSFLNLKCRHLVGRSGATFLTAISFNLRSFASIVSKSASIPSACGGMRPHTRNTVRHIPKPKMCPAWKGTDTTASNQRRPAWDLFPAPQPRTRARIILDSSLN